MIFLLSLVLLRVARSIVKPFDFGWLVARLVINDNVAGPVVPAVWGPK